MINPWQLRGVVALAIAAAVFFEWCFTGDFHAAVLLRAFLATAVVGAAIFLFDKYLWRWPPLQGWFVFRPNISGAWTAKISPAKSDPSTGKKWPRRSYRYNIHQTHSKLYVTMSEGPESEGENVCATIQRLDNDQYELVATFRNVPKSKVRERSCIHFGTMKLRIEGPAAAPAKLTGTYWTDRGTGGDIVAERDEK